MSGRIPWITHHGLEIVYLRQQDQRSKLILVCPTGFSLNAKRVPFYAESGGVVRIALFCLLARQF
jgi:hypothetical protein